MHTYVRQCTGLLLLLLVVEGTNRDAHCVPIQMTLQQSPP